MSIVSTATGGEQAGNITVATALTWNAATTLTLQADEQYRDQRADHRHAVHGGLTIDAGNSYYNEGASTVTATAAINVGTFTLVNGNWTQNSATLPCFHATDFRITGGQFLRVTGGDGARYPYQITDVYGLQGIGSSTEPAGQQNMSLPTTSTPVAPPTGTAAGASSRWAAPKKPSVAPFDGQSFAISGLTINPNTSVQHVGLFGYTDDGASAI